MQLFVTERQFCDFIVWWPHGVYVERIYVDKNFMEKKLKKALNFHKMCVLPELIYKYFSRKKVFSSKSTHCDGATSTCAQVEPRYCICNDTANSTKMIMCGNENCDKQWYHIKCLKMKRIPKSKWICDECR